MGRVRGFVFDEETVRPKPELPRGSRRRSPRGRSLLEAAHRSVRMGTRASSIPDLPARGFGHHAPLRSSPHSAVGTCCDSSPPPWAWPRRVRRSLAPGPRPSPPSGRSPRAEIPLVRLLRQAGVRPDRPLRPRHGGRLRASLAAPDDRSAWSTCRRRPLVSSSWAWSLRSRAACSSGSPARGEVIWNDREGGRFVCRILDVATRAMRTLPAAIYAVSPDARWAIAPTSAA